MHTSLSFQVMPLYMDTVHFPQWSECQVSIDLPPPPRLALGTRLPQPAWVLKDKTGEKVGLVEGGRGTAIHHTHESLGECTGLLHPQPMVLTYAGGPTHAHSRIPQRAGLRGGTDSDILGGWHVVEHGALRGRQNNKEGELCHARFALFLNFQLLV